MEIQNRLKKVTVLILICWIIYLLIVDNKKKKNIMRNHGFAISTIYKFDTKPKTWDSYFCRYLFIVKGDTIKSRIVKDFKPKEIVFLIYKKFPVIYENNNYQENNHILIYKEDFDLFNLSYPDSLKWVCDSLKVDRCR